MFNIIIFICYLKNNNLRYVITKTWFRNEFEVICESKS